MVRLKKGKSYLLRKEGPYYRLPKVTAAPAVSASAVLTVRAAIIDNTKVHLPDALENSSTKLFSIEIYLHRRQKISLKNHSIYQRVKAKVSLKSSSQTAGRR